MVYGAAIISVLTGFGCHDGLHKTINPAASVASLRVAWMVDECGNSKEAPQGGLQQVSDGSSLSVSPVPCMAEPPGPAASTV